MFLAFLLSTILFNLTGEARAMKMCRVFAETSIANKVEFDPIKYARIEDEAWANKVTYGYAMTPGPSDRRNLLIASANVNGKVFAFPVTQSPFKRGVLTEKLFTVVDGRVISVSAFLRQLFEEQKVEPEFNFSLTLSDGRDYVPGINLTLNDGHFRLSDLDDRIVRLLTEQPNLEYVVNQMVLNRNNGHAILLFDGTLSINQFYPKEMLRDAIATLIGIGALRPGDLTTEKVRIVNGDRATNQFILFRLDHGQFTDFVALDLSERIFTTGSHFSSPIFRPVSDIDRQSVGDTVVDLFNGRRLPLMSLRNRSFEQALEQRSLHP